MKHENLLKKFILSSYSKYEKDYNKHGYIYAVYVNGSGLQKIFVKTYKTENGAIKHINESRYPNALKYEKFTKQEVLDNGGWLV